MLSDNDLEAAKSSVLFKSMPETVSESLLRGAFVQEYGSGENIFIQGETARVIHVVLGGWAKLYRIAHNGNEAVVAVFTRGSSFGEAVALQQDKYPVSGEAVTDCTLLQIPARVFTTMMKERPEICVSVLAATFHHLHYLVSQIEQIKAQTGAQRVAEFLLELATYETGTCVVTLPYDKALIAGRLGMKPERLSRAFSRLRSVGVRISGNHASIDDAERLRKFAAKDPALAWSKAL